MAFTASFQKDTRARTQKQIQGLRLVCVIWLVAVCASLIASVIKGGADLSLLFGLAIALAPAALSFALSPISDKEWVRVLIVMSWVALAVAACLAISFMPMAFLFLCAPAAAVLFKSEMVVEAMILSALSAGAVYCLSLWGMSGSVTVSQDSRAWATATAPAVTIVFMIGAMFAVATQGDEEYGDETYTGSNDLDGNNSGANGVKRVAAGLDVNALIGISFLTNEYGEVLSVSKAAATALHLGEHMPTNLNQVIRVSDSGRVRFSDLMSAAIISNDTLERVVQLEDTDDKRSFLMSIDPQGDTASVLLMDVTKQVDALAQLEKFNRDAHKSAEEKSLFFAGVSHELRTPLNAIIGFSDMMRSRLFGPLPGKYAEYADLIHDSGQHMLDLIGDVLDLSKIDAGHYELTYDNFDMADVVRSTIKMIRPAADAAHVVLDVEIAGDDPILVSADRRAVRQILLNLLSNAVKFTPKGGRVTSRVSADAREVVLTVSDTGSGMSEADLKAAGTPYVQTQSGKSSESRGTGLGLSLVKSLTDLHKGRFILKSSAGLGTDASVFLPLEGLH